MSASSTSPGIKIECPVCLYPFDTISALPVAGPCLHNICEPCWEGLKVKNCPKCLAPINTPSKNCELLEFIEQTTQMMSGQIPDTTQNETPLERAVTKANDFLVNEWPSESLYAGRLTPTDMDLLWGEQQHVAERITDKIYRRLCDFPTYRCRALEMLSSETALQRYNLLCHLVAREKAVAARNPIALYCEAICMRYGIFRPKNLTKALEAFREASNAGVALATHQVGVFLYEGFGVKVDAKAAVKQFRLAYKQGCLESATYLGLCYISGNGVRKEYFEGIEYWETAAEGGDVKAMMYLGDYYSKREKNYLGRDDPDYDTAIEWYDLAKMRGNKRAAEEKARCEKLKSSPQGGCVIQ